MLETNTENVENQELTQEQEQEATQATEETLQADEKNEQKNVDPEEESFREQFLRLNADFQNYKRRVEKERFEWMQEARGSVLEKLLPIFDELDRALNLAKENSTEEKQQWLDGLLLIQKNWGKTLKELGVEEISGSGEFDPELHDALMQVDSEDKKAGEIVQLLSKGYKLKDKVILHAKVSVAK